MKVDKEKKKVWIYTQHYRINGNLHVLRGSRLSDMLAATSQKSDFIPVTECTVYNEKGDKLFEVPFLSLNRRFIVMIFEEVTP